MLDFVTMLLIIVEVVTCFLLLGVILIQKTKGQGIGMAFGAAVGETLFGARAGNVLTRATVVLAIAFLVNTTFLAMLGTRHRRGDSVTDVIESGPAPAMAPNLPMGTEPDPGAMNVADLPDAPAAGLPAPATPVDVPAIGDQPLESLPPIPVDAAPAQ